MLPSSLLMNGAPYMVVVGLKAVVTTTDMQPSNFRSKGSSGTKPGSRKESGSSYPTAIDRYNTVTFEGMKLAVFHILRQLEQHGEEAFQPDEKGKIHLLEPIFLRNCIHAVSRQKPGDTTPTSMDDKNPSLHASFLAYQRGLPAGHVFAHRQGIAQAIEYGIKMEIVNAKVGVKVHLPMRIKRWIVVQLGKVLPRDIADKHVWALADRMVSRVVHDEAKKAAIARSEGRDPPPIPAWEAPASAVELLGDDWLEERFANRPLTQASIDGIWGVWTTLLEYMGPGMLPLCPTHFDGKDGWKTYLPLLFRMLKDVEETEGRQAVARDEASKRPTSNWAEGEVTKILASSPPEQCDGTTKCPVHGKHACVKSKMVKAAAAELVNSINEKREFNRLLKDKVLARLNDAQVKKLEEMNVKTIAEISTNTFRREQHVVQRRGPHRLFHILPQHGCATRYFPMYTEVLYDLYVLLWREEGHPEAETLKRRKDQRADFYARRGYWWNTVFDLR